MGHDTPILRVNPGTKRGVMETIMVLDADWINVNVASRPLKAAQAAYSKAQAEANALRAKMEAIKTAELRQAGEVSVDEEPVYSHKFGRWSVATSKVDGSVIGRMAKGSKGAKRSSI